MLNLVQVRAFVAVARELHFGRAAQRLNMTQPPLSRQIVLLEQHLGARLFDRNRQTVRLTPAGRSFLIEAEELLLHSARVERVLRSDFPDQRGNLTLGFFSGSVYRLLPRIVARMRQSLPNIQLRLEEMTAAEQFQALADGRIDLGIMRPVTVPEVCHAEAIYQEKLVLALPFDHPMVRGGPPEIAQLGDEPFIMYRDDAPYMHRMLTAIFRQHGISPRIVQSHSQAHTILSLVSASLGLAILPEDVGHASFRTIVLRPFAPSSGMVVKAHAVSLRNNQNPAIAPVMDLLRRLVPLDQILGADSD